MLDYLDPQTNHHMTFEAILSLAHFYIAKLLDLSANSQHPAPQTKLRVYFKKVHKWCLEPKSLLYGYTRDHMT